MEFLCLEIALQHIAEAMPRSVPAVDARQIDYIVDAEDRWSRAAGLLYATIHNAQDPRPRWFEMDRTVGHALARESVQAEAMHALSYAARWADRRRLVRLERFRQKIAATAPPGLYPRGMIPIDGGKWPPGQTDRGLQIGFNREHLFAFLDTQKVAYVKVFPTPTEIAQREFAEEVARLLGRKTSHKSRRSTERPADSNKMSASRNHQTIRYTLDTGEVAFVFRDIRWDQCHWTTNLQDPPQWLREHKLVSGSRGGTSHSKSRWDPLGIAKAVVSRAKSQEEQFKFRGELSERFARERLLKPILAEWLEHDWFMHDSANAGR